MSQFFSLVLRIITVFSYRCGHCKNETKYKNALIPCCSESMSLLSLWFWSLWEVCSISYRTWGVQTGHNHTYICECLFVIHAELRIYVLVKVFPILHFFFSINSRYVISIMCSQTCIFRTRCAIPMHIKWYCSLKLLCSYCLYLKNRNITEIYL
jgi:hypothetical protein